MQKIFFSQTILDSLIQEGRIRLEGDLLTLLTGENPSFQLEPGYRILRTADKGPDPHGLVGQIWYEKDLRREKAELYLNSLIYSDTAYEAEQGFIGEKKELIDTLSDTDLLARFLLDSLL